ncbi:MULTISPECIES: hypothetical protein [unclassified Streptomyces]|uniref:hypothetical protein n=1 Tax=unclassified Streptomyces TaxID=2593676 RepID=UPI00081F736A|nr:MULTISPECIES: hypothetical protein [unclassified Streptomyces]SCF94710.1 hypothetical protein GA0115259_105384 [Streptomyces sp. MnatMP-M17]
MRLRVEFTTEPFDLDEAPAHAVVAREIVQSAELDAVDVGPFGNTAEGGAEAVLSTVDALLRRSLAVGATRISLQVNVIGDDRVTDITAAASAADVATVEDAR